MVDGYDGWTEALRLETKLASDKAKAVLISTKEEFKSATSILEMAFVVLTPEEQSKAKAIAGNAIAEYHALEEENISVEAEVDRVKVILEKAEAELKTFNLISERAEKRLDKAQSVFDKAKGSLDRTAAEVKAAKIIFDNAMTELNGPSTALNNIESLSSGGTTNSAKLAAANADNLYKLAKEEYNKSESLLNIAKEEVSEAEDRLDTVKVYVAETATIFDNTPVVCEGERPAEEPTYYFDNFVWDTHHRDLLVVEAQLRSAKAELTAAEALLDTTTLDSSRTIESLVEANLKKAKAILSLAKDRYSEVAELYETNKLSSLKVELENAESDYNKAERYLANMELSLADAIKKEARLEFYRASDSADSTSAKLLKDKANTGFSEAKAKSDGTDLRAINTSTSSLPYSLDDTDSAQLSTKYAVICLNKVKGELSRAEADYIRAVDTFASAKSLLDNFYIGLSSASQFLSKEKLDEFWSSYQFAVASFDKNIAQLESVRSDLSPLDIKLEPGLIESKAYTEVLLADAELDNAKWIFNQLKESLNNAMLNKIKLANVVFSDSPTLTQVSADGGSAYNSGSSASTDGASSGEDPKGDKSYEEIRDIISKIEAREIVHTKTGLFVECLHTYKDLVGTMADKDIDSVKNLLFRFIPQVIDEELMKNRKLKDCINDVIAHINDIEDGVYPHVRQRINFDSYLIADDDLAIPEVSGTGKAGKVFRLLEVDNRLFVPTNTHIRVLVTSADVLHSWAVPSLGVKVDACPGRLNQVFLFVKREGVFYGQCSELCGVNHGFMPIVVQAVSQDDYLTWVGKRLCS